MVPYNYYFQDISPYLSQDALPTTTTMMLLACPVLLPTLPSAANVIIVACVGV